MVPGCCPSGRYAYYRNDFRFDLGVRTVHYHYSNRTVTYRFHQRFGYRRSQYEIEADAIERRRMANDRAANARAKEARADPNGAQVGGRTLPPASGRTAGRAARQCQDLGGGAQGAERYCYGRMVRTEG